MDLAGFEPHTLRSANKIKNIIYYIIINVSYQFK